MNTAVPVDAATARRLRSLRIRITALITLLAAVVVTVFAVFVVRLDRDLRDEQNEAELLRLTDGVARSLSFSESELIPADPSPLVDDDVALGIRPEFDIIRILDERELWDEIPEPDPEEIVESARAIYFDLEPDLRFELLWEVGDPEEEDPDDLVDRLLDDPPDPLLDEAYRRYVDDAAEDADLDLSLETEIVVGDDAPVGIDELRDAVAAVADDDEESVFEITARDGGAVLARGTPLRNGPEVRGAVIAVLDPSGSDDAHGRLRTGVAALGAVLVGGAALAAWLIAGRTIRPAATALAQQERFLTGAAHELRTPIAAIRATAESDEGEAVQRLARIRALAEGASTLTDDLMTLARMDAEGVPLRLEPTRLDLLVEALVDDDPSFALVLDATVVDADSALTERAIRNLLANAVAHGGATPQRPATVRVDHSGVTVTDSGPGVGAAEREAIFERFRSGPASVGHGLGLPLARWIARAHGGDLVVAEAPWGGAEFHLRLDGR